jgi:RNA polymerase sigma factor (sigma-70 family)
MPAMEFLGDEELIKGCIRGDRRKQEMLYRKYATAMYKICVAYEPNHDYAKDILQDAFIKVFKTISTFNNQGSLQGWIRKIITNTAIDHFRQAKIAESRLFAIDSLKRTEEPNSNDGGVLESEIYSEL